MCFELDPADMLTVKMGPKYIGIASEKEAPGSSYEDIRSWSKLHAQIQWNLLLHLQFPEQP